MGGRRWVSGVSRGQGGGREGKGGERNSRSPRGHAHPSKTSLLPAPYAASCTADEALVCVVQYEVHRHFTCGSLKWKAKRERRRLLPTLI